MCETSKKDSARSPGQVKPYYLALDGLRGVAAILVVAFHVGLTWNQPIVRGAYLAVDFFFILSGFVIAAAYDERLREGMTSAAFIVRRLIRLWPLFALALLIAAPFEIARAFAAGAQQGYASVESLGLSSLMLPSPWLSPAHFLYPMNVPAWSLFCELVANIAYGVFGRWLTSRRLWVIVGLSLLMLALVARADGSFAGGDTSATLPMGLARAAFGFSTGLLLHRLHREGALKSSLWTIVSAAVLVGALVLRPPGWIGDFVVTVAVFPVLIALAARVNPQKGLVEDASRALGRASYAIYILHIPLLAWLSFAFHRAGFRLDTPAAVTISLIAVTLTALAADHFWDVPIRAVLTRQGRRLFAV